MSTRLDRLEAQLDEALAAGEISEAEARAQMREAVEEEISNLEGEYLR